MKERLGLESRKLKQVSRGARGFGLLVVGTGLAIGEFPIMMTGATIWASGWVVKGLASTKSSFGLEDKQESPKLKF